jgi:protein phosphatase
MAKKEHSNQSPFGSDKANFFAEISSDLKNQMNNFASGSPSDNQATASSDGDVAQLFANEADEIDLEEQNLDVFDNSAINELLTLSSNNCDENNELDSVMFQLSNQSVEPQGKSLALTENHPIQEQIMSTTKKTEYSIGIRDKHESDIALNSEQSPHHSTSLDYEIPLSADDLIDGNLESKMSSTTATADTADPQQGQVKAAAYPKQDTQASNDLGSTLDDLPQSIVNKNASIIVEKQLDLGVVVVQKEQNANGNGKILSSQKPLIPSADGFVLHANGLEYTLLSRLEQSEERVLWQASADFNDDQPPQDAQIVELCPERYRAFDSYFSHLHKDIALQRPIVVEKEDRAFLIYLKPSGYVLSEKILHPHHHWTIQQLQSFMKSIGDAIDAMHDAGYLFLQLDADHIWIGGDRQARIFGIEELYTVQTSHHKIPIIEGFTAPEIYHQQIPPGIYSDIFSLGILLHYMISKSKPFNHLDIQLPNIPSPRIYQLDFPVGLDSVLFRACHPNPNMRYQTILDFLEDLDRAVEEISSRHRQARRALNLSVAHDIHIGISKGQRNPTNQDALFWRYDKKHHKGIFLIADGVSHCNYGSGDRASSILIGAVREHWNRLTQKDIFSQPMSIQQRRRFLQAVFDTTNEAIANEINSLYDRVDGYVEDVMGTTSVVGLLDSNEITIANLGDSRAYLKTPHYIEQINIDHNYKTAQIQMGCDMRSVQNLKGASLITRCVGSCRKDQKQKVVPLQLQPDFFDLKLRKDDILLLCSDGLSDYAGNSESESREMIAKILETYNEPISACFWLTVLANQRGGGDNISVIEIKVLDVLPER